MSDLISRQAAIEAMEQRYCDIERVKRRPVTKGEQAIFLDMRGTVRSLPSVEPEKSECPWYGNDGKCHFAEQEMDECDDCISRKAAVEAVRDHDWMQAVFAIAYMPSVEPERKKGKWIPFRVIDVCGDAPFMEYRCSICERRINCMSDSLSHYPYCHCGADMREVQDE